MNVKKSEEFKIDIGGHFSSRPVNTGYLGLTYQNIGRIATSLHAESYFGKFYGSIKTDFELEFPNTLPILLRGYFIMNRWDYFQSFATFFEDVRPSFLIQNEMYLGLDFKFPVTNNSYANIDFRYFDLEDEYALRFHQAIDLFHEIIDVDFLDNKTLSIALNENDLLLQKK